MEIQSTCLQTKKFVVNWKQKQSTNDGSCQTCSDDNTELIKDIVDEARIGLGVL